MARFLIQSLETGKFLCPSLEGDEPVWVRCLADAGGGVVDSLDAVAQLIEDCCEFDDVPRVIDIDRLGTSGDYPVAL